MTAPDRAWVSAGTHAALVAWDEWDAPAWQPMAEVVQAVIEAVEPLIRAQIAADIEAAASEWGHADALYAAARIARGRS